MIDVISSREFHRYCYVEAGLFMQYKFKKINLPFSIRENWIHWFRKRGMCRPPKDAFLIRVGQPAQSWCVLYFLARWGGRINSPGNSLCMTNRRSEQVRMEWQEMQKLCTGRLHSHTRCKVSCKESRRTKVDYFIGYPALQNKVCMFPMGHWLRPSVLLQSEN